MKGLGTTVVETSFKRFYLHVVHFKLRISFFYDNNHYIMYTHRLLVISNNLLVITS